MDLAQVRFWKGARSRVWSHGDEASFGTAGVGRRQMTARFHHNAGHGGADTAKPPVSCPQKTHRRCDFIARGRRKWRQVQDSNLRSSQPRADAAWHATCLTRSDTEHARRRRRHRRRGRQCRRRGGRPPRARHRQHPGMLLYPGAGSSPVTGRRGSQTVSMRFDWTARPLRLLQQQDRGEAEDQPDGDDPEGVRIGRHIGLTAHLRGQRHQRPDLRERRIGAPA